MCFVFTAVKPIATKIKNLRLRREDFDPLNLIGKGAFGEVNILIYFSESDFIFCSICEFVPATDALSLYFPSLPRAYRCR